MKRTWKNFRLDKNKVYQFIGQAVVYSSLYIGSIAFFYWMFLQRINLLGGNIKMNYMKIKEIKYLKNIEDVNKALKENWLLMLITTNKDNGIEYLIGRI